ncbi:uncharacterized protein TNCV_2970021 [Trichonephila clavipes]|nr:uncharacterized protein TNCV_2970021 [Trichonephila clavipes]
MVSLGHPSFPPTDLGILDDEDACPGLIDGYSSRKRKGRLASFQTNKCVVPDYLRLASVGEIICQRWFPNTDDVGNVAKRDKKRGSAACVQCDVLLGIVTCFSSFHGK